MNEESHDQSLDHAIHRIVHGKGANYEREEVADHDSR